MDRATKQFIYGGFYLAIIFGIGALVYVSFIKPAPSCTNFVKDKGEEGVDCGGVCQKICLPPDLRPIRVQEVRSFSPLGSNLVAVLAKIQNPNAGIAARNFSYTLNLYDAAGGTLKTISGAGFVYASEVKYIAEFVSGHTASEVRRAELTIQNPEWVKKETFTKPAFGIQDRRIEVVTSTVQVGGRLMNQDVVAIPRVAIIAIFHGGAGISPIGVSRTELDNVAPGDVRPFVIIHPPLLGIDPAKTELVVSARRP